MLFRLRGKLTRKNHSYTRDTGKILFLMQQCRWRGKVRPRDPPSVWPDHQHILYPSCRPAPPPKGGNRRWDHCLWDSTSLPPRLSNIPLNPYSTASHLRLPTVSRFPSVDGKTKRHFLRQCTDDHQMSRMCSPPSPLFLLCNFIDKLDLLFVLHSMK